MNDVVAEVRVGGERVYSGRVVKLDVDRVRLADGGERSREIIRHPGATIIVPLLPDGRVVLIRQWRYCAEGELIELPAGTLEPGIEDHLTCAKRELAEETGFEAAQWRELGSFFTTPGFTTEVIAAYLATDLTPVTGVAGDEDEHIEVFTVPFASALAMIRSGEIRDAKTICALHFAGEALRA